MGWCWGTEERSEQENPLPHPPEASRDWPKLQRSLPSHPLFPKGDRSWKGEAPSQSKQKTSPHAAPNFFVRSCKADLHLLVEISQLGSRGGNHSLRSCSEKWPSLKAGPLASNPSFNTKAVAVPPQPYAEDLAQPLLGCGLREWEMKVCFRECVFMSQWL